MTEWSKLSSWATVQQGHTGQVRRPCALTHCFSLELHQRVQVCVDTVWCVDRVWHAYDTYIEHLLLWVGPCGDWGACGTYTLYAIGATGWGACGWHVYPHTEWGRVDVCRVIASSWRRFCWRMPPMRSCRRMPRQRMPRRCIASSLKRLKQSQRL